MKKSKVILAIVLAVVLIITCMSVPTFSWFTRPQSQSGDVMKLSSKNVYGVYNGKNVSIVSTKMSADGGFTYVTPDDLNGSGVISYGRNYYCTTIKNESGSDMNVSLYASKLSIDSDPTNGTLALGVNYPTRSYRDYSALATQTFTASNSTMRIYFEKDNNVLGWNGTDFYICWNEDTNTSSESLGETGSNGTYYKMTWVGDPGHQNHYYADIPRTATHAFFCVANWGTHDNGEPDYWLRSQTLWNLAGDGQAWNTPKLYKITSDETTIGGDHKVHTVQKYDSPGVGIDTYYSSVSLAGGQTYSSSTTLNAILPSSWYIGGSVEYYSSDESLFTVNMNTGVITTNSTGKVGEATLYTKVINSSNGYWDAKQVETTIKVTSSGAYEFNDVPIVRNILIPGTAGDDSEHPQNVKEIYWYVMNNSPRSLKYEISGVYLGM